jgi:hypothetical protein
VQSAADLSVDSRRQRRLGRRIQVKKPSCRCTHRLKT